MDYRFFLYIVFGILPSLVWLSYYLRKDLHPEPKRMIMKIFLWGAIITVPVFFVQIGLSELLAKANISPLATSLIYWFVIIALTEEIFKFLVVRLKVKSSKHLDEPTDIMIYMVVTALGFAALENILYLFSPTGILSLEDLINRTLMVSFIRFIGATFLHTLCSAVIGYFVAISIFKKGKNFILTGFGFLLAIGLHGLYDFSIITIDGYLKLAIPVIILLTLAIIAFAGFDKLKKKKGVCELNLNEKQ